jgi:hypothetical protein
LEKLHGGYWLWQRESSSCLVKNLQFTYAQTTVCWGMSSRHVIPGAHSVTSARLRFTHLKTRTIRQSIPHSLLFFPLNSQQSYLEKLFQVSSSIFSLSCHHTLLSNSICGKSMPLSLPHATPNLFMLNIGYML